jgi:hypothetical protein
MNKRSKKHHYLPRHYLKGFTNKENGFFVYDKKEDKIFLTSPDNTFFEKNLNTIDLPKDGPSDFLEYLYTDIENNLWGSFNKIRSYKPDKGIEELDKMNLFLFLLVLHWRLPSSAKNLENLSKEMLPNQGSVLDFLKLYSGERGSKEEASEEMKKIVRESESFKGITKLVAPFAPFMKDKDWFLSLKDWMFFYTEDEQSWHIVGDRPIITDRLNDHDPLKCLSRFVFPISGRILLVNHDKALKQNLSREFTIEYSMAVIAQAERFVACHNEEFLKKLVDMYKKVYIKFDKVDDIIPDMFITLTKDSYGD